MRLLSQLKIGTRLGGGFALLMSLLVGVAAVALQALQHSEAISDQLVEVEWAKASALAQLDAASRGNALATTQLFFAVSPSQAQAIKQQIDTNRGKVSAAVDTLDHLLQLPEPKALLAQLKQARSAYVSSFTQVQAQLAQGQRDEAVTTLRDQTLPRIATMQTHIDALQAVQGRRVAEMRTDMHQAQASMQRLLLLAAGIGLMAGTVLAWALTRSITRPIHLAVRVAQTVAAGDLSQRLEVTQGDETGELLRALMDMNSRLARIVGDVRQSSDSIATGSSHIATGNTDLSQRTEEQAANLEQTAASMEELTATVKHNADTAREASQLATHASEAATTGGAVVQQVVGRMQDIAHASKRIADIIGVIDGIAFQTNILALNAAVEAARAGEQGRGFAVVAAEVRGLAQRSAQAAREIKLLINDSVSQVDAGSQLADEAGRSMRNIVAQVQRVTHLISEISNANLEQTQGIDQVGQAVQQLDQVTQQNAALVEQSAAAAESLKHQASQLASLVSVFKLGHATA